MFILADLSTGEGKNRIHQIMPCFGCVQHKQVSPVNMQQDCYCVHFKISRNFCDIEVLKTIFKSDLPKYP